MSSFQEGLRDYENALKDLVFNSKPIISSLTMIAEDYLGVNNGPKKIAELILERILTVDDTQKLPVLYLIDSICKNIGKDYIESFEPDIVSIFKHVFEHSDETTRAALFKLRSTWKPVFSRSTLHAIDAAAQSIDPAWPVTNSPTQSNASASKRRKENDSTSSTMVPSKRKASSNIAHSINASSASIAKRKPVIKQVPTTTATVPKRKLASSESTSSASKPVTSLGSHDRDYRKEFEPLINEVGKKLNDGVLSNKDRADIIQSINQVMKGSSSDLGGLSSLPVKKRAPGPVSTLPNVQAKDPVQGQDQTLGPVNVPLQLPPAPIQSTSQISSLPIPAQASIPNQLQAATISSFVSSLDYHQPLPMKPLETIPPLCKDIGQQYVQVDGNTVKLFYLDENTSIVLMKGSLHLSLNELVKANPYDLEPRMIMFEGKPTKVYIDSDKGSKEFVLLNFNSQPQTFFHGEHAQRIKLGGPCREIILNGKPYQASFGGPPIEVKFVGDTHQTHTLRLSGPPPRVKISEDLRADLWSEYVKKITGQSDENPIPAVQTSYSSLPPATQTPYSQNILGTQSSSAVLLPPSTVQPASSLVPALTTQINPLAPGLVTNPTVAISTPIPTALPIPVTVAMPLTAPCPTLPLPVTLPLQVPGPAVVPSLTNSVPVTMTAPTTEPQVNLGDLFDKLISVGIIKKTEPQITDSNKLLATTITTTTATSTLPSSLTVTAIGASPSVTSIVSATSSTNLATSVTRIGSPSSMNRENGLNQLDEIESEPLVLETKSLKADHPKVIADLINGTQCPNCSLRFEVGDSNERSKYSVHLDWHFRLNRQERTDSKSKSAAVRRWFCSLDLWVSFKEISDETDQTMMDADKEEKESASEKKVCTVSANEDESLNECAVCKERFETTWNEDEEEWQLLNAVKGQDEKIYHPLCLEDLLKQRSAENEASNLTATNGQEDKTEVKPEGDNENETKQEDSKEEIKMEVDDEVKHVDVVKKEDILNNIDDDDIDDDFTLYPAETKGQIEVSVCCIS